MSEVKEFIEKSLDTLKANIEADKQDLSKSVEELRLTNTEEIEKLSKGFKKQEETIVSLQNQLKQTNSGNVSELAKSILDFGKKHEGVAKAFLAGEKMQVLSKVITIGSNFTGQVTRFDQRPGIAPILSRSVRLRNVLRNTVATSNIYNFRKHTSSTGAVAPVLEATTKSIREYNLANVEVPVIKIAGYSDVSMEALDDTDDFEAFLTSKLRDDYLDTEDTQILYGSGVAPNMEGLNITSLKAADITSFDPVTAPQKWDAIIASRSVLTGREYEPSVVLLNPAEYESMTVTKGTDAHYIANELVFTGATAMVRGMTIIKTTAVNAGEFFVMDARAAELAIRKSVTVDRSDENGTNFIDNIYTFRIEGRAALAKIYPDMVFSDTFANVITAITTP